MRKLLALVGALATALVMLPSAPALASVASPSPGCAQMNSPSYDATYASMTLATQFGYDFAAGERLIVTATIATGSATMGLQVFGVGGTQVTAAVPNTLTIMLVGDLTGANDGVGWSLPSSAGVFNATWTVECIPYTAPASSSGEGPADPAPLIQQVGRSAGAPCAVIESRDLTWGSALTGGWKPSWARWANQGLGGEICTRTLVFRNGTWQIEI